MLSEESDDLEKPKYRKILPKQECGGDESKTNFVKKLKRAYKCCECPEAFNSFRQLKAHERFLHSTCTADVVSICRYCCSLYANAETLKKHEKEAHNGDNPYCCPPCDKHYKSKGYLLKHVSRVHQTNALLYYCTLCSRSNSAAAVEFPSKLELEKHFNEMHLLMPIEQEDNVESDNVEIEMKEEFLDEFLFCNTNENSFQNSECWDALDLHLTDVLHLLTETNHSTEDSTVATFKCPKCCEDCQNQKALLLHLAHKHSLNVLICSKCEASFNSVSKLAQHKATHSHELLLGNITLGKVCHICDRNFKTSAALNYHIKTHTRSSTTLQPPPHECPYCGKGFHTDLNMKQHLRTVHSQVKKQICQLCDKQFASLDHLKKHVLSQHQNERKHICDICSKRFTQLCHLKQHIRIHTTGKTLQCNLCAAKFWKKIDLERHTIKKHDQ